MSLEKCLAVFVCKLSKAAFKVHLSSRQMPRLLPRHIYVCSICLSKKKCQGNLMIMMMMFFTQISNLTSWRRRFTVLSTCFAFSFYTFVYPHISVLFSYFCRSLISVSKKRDIERILTQGYRIWVWMLNMLLSKLIVLFILQLVLRRFYRLIFAPSRKS